MQCWIELNAKALVNNYKNFTELVGKKKLVPVIKANAYGHGLVETYEILKQQRPDWLCTNYVFEAGQLRSLGFKGRILVVGPLVKEDLEFAYEQQAEIIIGDFETLALWLKPQKKPKVHIKIDTGMSRQGFLVKDIPTAVEQLSKHKAEIVGVCTHFANVEDVLEHDYADLQIQRLLAAAKIFKTQHFQFLLHAASSASTLILEESRFDLCRVGISLYGFWPSKPTRLSYLQKNSELLSLQPVLSWRTVVSMTKTVTKGDYIGYGCTYKAVKDMTVAVLPVGYYEGYPRLAGNDRSYVLLNGSRAPIIGRICMNMMMIDISHINGVRKGDVVTLIGQDKDEIIQAPDLADWAQTIHYEIVTRLNPMIPRKIL